MRSEGDRQPGKRLASNETDKAPKEEKQKKTSRLTRQQKLLIALAVVLAVAIAGVAIWRALFVRPDVSAEKEPPVIQDPETGETEEIDWGEGTRPRSDGERKSEDYYTVLILGRDTGGGGNTDTMLLASYDVTNQKATVMSIPRDTMVNVPWDIKKINSVYSYYGGGDRGIQYLYKEISQLVGFEPDFQVVVEWEAVGKIVDAMGGVWFDVPRDMYYSDPLQNLYINQKAGYRLLSGDDAMQVLRFRKGANGYATGDIGRIETQQAFLQAMVEQLLKIENITKINQFAEVFQTSVTTDLTLQNILWFAKAAFTGGLKAENVTFTTMPNTPKYAYSSGTSRLNGYYTEQSYVVPNANALLELVNTSLSPYSEVFTRSDLDIMMVNADGSVSSSTGHVEDGNATYPRSYWQAQWAPKEPEEPSDTGETTDPNTGTVTDPNAGGSTTDPNTGAVIDPNTGTVTDPNGGGTPTDPNTGGSAADPNTGTVIDPNTGAVTDPNGGGTPTDPNAGGSAADPNTGAAADPNTGAVTDPNGGGTAADPGTGGTATGPNAGGTTTGPGTTGDPGFSIIEPPPAA